MSRAHSIRAFLAVEPAPLVLRRIADHVEQLRAREHGEDIRWVANENLHVTLRFLGEVLEEDLERMVPALEAAVAKVCRFEVQLGRVVLFPSSRRPRVIALEIQPEEPLKELFQGVESGLKRAGFAAEKRSFRAHLSLGRLRGSAYPSLEGELGLDGARFWINEVVLFRSVLRSQGAIHTALKQFPLEG